MARSGDPVEDIHALIRRNHQWADGVAASDPAFFSTLASQQAPDYLWIGCSDSRVPANQVVDMAPGEVFVHRNVANLVGHTDLNALSVIQYAVEVLQVRHILITGHYGCGGVRAALEEEVDHGLIDNWLEEVRRVAREHDDELAAIADFDARVDRLCELNVAAQVESVCHTSVVRNAWRGGQELAVHGLVYGLADGRLQPVGEPRTGAEMD